MLLFRSPRAIAAEGEEEGNAAMRAKGMECPNATSRGNDASHRVCILMSFPAHPFFTRTLHRDVIYLTSDKHIQSRAQSGKRSDNGVRS